MEPINFSIFKHYTENDGGYELNSENETVKDAFMSVNHVSGISKTIKYTK